MDIGIDPDTGDLLLDDAGDLVFVAGRDAIAQHVRVRLQFVLGEWFLDTREGVPWFEQIWVANPDLSAITELFRRTIGETPGVASVRALVLDFDRQSRTMTVSRAEVVTTNGELIEPEDFKPFVIVDPTL